MHLKGFNINIQYNRSNKTLYTLINLMKIKIKSICDIIDTFYTK